MRIWTRLLGLGLALTGMLGATTLQQLTLDDMIQKSTAIVRARVTGSQTAYFATGHGSDIYTHFQLQILETWKAPANAQAVTDVAIPGGVVNGVRQMVAGAPGLKPDQEYVLFLWTSPSGLTQVIGLSQGVFNLSGGSSSGTVAQRPAASELMLDGSGLPVQDHALNMPLQDLKTRVLHALGAAK